MTGGTLIIRKGNFYTITRVAHDGFLDRTFYVNSIQNLVNSGASGKEICINFLRQRNCGTFEEFADVMTDQVNNCLFEASIPSLKKSTNLDEIMSKLDDLLNEEFDKLSDDEQDQSPLMVLSCSYVDYILFIDLDTKTPYFSHEE